MHHIVTARGVAVAGNRLLRILAASATLAGGIICGGTAAAWGATAPPNQYVALGDSFAAGPLIGQQLELDPCFRSAQDYAHVAAAELGLNLDDVTCSGATTGDFTGSQAADLPWDPSVPPQFDALSARTRVVTVTIGGNDVGLVGVAEGCINLLPVPLGHPCAPAPGAPDPVSAAIGKFGPRFGHTLAEIRQLAPHAKIFVTSYATYIPPNGCWPLLPIYPGDANWLQARIDQLAAVEAAQTAEHGDTLVNLIKPSVGHDACQVLTGDNWVSGVLPISFNGNLIAVPFHPTQLGEQSFGQIVAAAIKKAGIG
jgi:lysophospholipase L1-like esterase